MCPILLFRCLGYIREQTDKFFALLELTLCWEKTDKIINYIVSKLSGKNRIEEIGEGV